MRELSAIERIERKWSLHNANKTQFYIAILRSNFHFNKEYESRNVNSIYFDDSDLNSLYENIDGNTYKAKYRVRWYGNFTQINLAKFEIKMKKGILSKKKFFKIKNEKMNLNQDSLKILTNEVNKILNLKKKFNPF